ncbi:MAG: hypothetical protein L0Z46_12435 [Nitrospiraceae bacterium]|nr:hypothetical protein [Nitrospiraceae bacterium]
MKIVVISCIFLLASSSYLHAEDCAKQFLIGEFGIPQSDSVVAAGLPYGKQYEPVYMEKREVQEKPEVCPDVYASDVFQLKLTREDRFLLAACYGDLNSDGKRDYALLLRNIADEMIQLRIFIHAPGGYRVIPVQKPVTFKDGPYIPQCIRKPSDGIFVGLEEEKYKVTGDLIRYGWYTYFWEGNGLREILTSD